LDSTGSGQGPVAGCCKCGDEHSSSCTTEFVRDNMYTLGPKQDIRQFKSSKQLIAGNSMAHRENLVAGRQ
jgi:hypothetical protein